MLGLTSLGCESATDPVKLSVFRISGNVTSSADGEPIEGVTVALVWQVVGGFGAFPTGTESGTTDAGGEYTITMVDVLCSPETFEIVFTIPDGYRLLPERDYIFVVQCVEDVQVFDFQFEPF